MLPASISALRGLPEISGYQTDFKSQRELKRRAERVADKVAISVLKQLVADWPRIEDLARQLLRHKRLSGADVLRISRGRKRFVRGSVTQVVYFMRNRCSERGLVSTLRFFVRATACGAGLVLQSAGHRDRRVRIRKR
jgi:hypothetical protein